MASDLPEFLNGDDQRYNYMIRQMVQSSYERHKEALKLQVTRGKSELTCGFEVKFYTTNEDEVESEGLLEEDPANPCRIYLVCQVSDELLNGFNKSSFSCGP